MTTLSLSPSLHTQKWTLGGDPFASRLCLKGSEIALGEAGDTDLAKIASAFGTYLSAPERQTEDLSKKLIVAHNAGQIFGKVASHNQKVYDNTLITICHVILAILTLGIFSFRDQYLIDMPKADLLPGIDLAQLGDGDNQELRENLSMREFFFLDETRREEFLNNLVDRFTAGCEHTLPSLQMLPFDAQGAVSLGTIGSTNTKSDGNSTITTSALDWRHKSFFELTDGELLAMKVSEGFVNPKGPMFNGLITAPQTEISGEWIRLIGARLARLPKNEAPLDPDLRQRTLGDLSRFSPKEVMTLLGELSEDGVMAAHTLFPRDLFFKAIFSREVILDAIKAAEGVDKDGKGDPIGVLSKNASLALYGFFADHPFSHVEEATSRPNSPFESVEVKAASFPHTPKPRRELFAYEVEHGSLRTRVQIDNEELAKRLHSYFTTLLDEIEKTLPKKGADPGHVTITAIFKTFASDRPDVRAFFQCLSAEVLDKCDWESLEPGDIAAILWDYNQERFMQLSEKSQVAILNKLGEGKDEIGGFWVPELLPDQFWGDLPELSIAAQKALFSPSGLDLPAARKEVLRQYHLNHWDLISRGKEGADKMRMLSQNGAFPKELLEKQSV